MLFISSRTAALFKKANQKLSSAIPYLNKHEQAGMDDGNKAVPDEVINEINDNTETLEKELYLTKEKLLEEVQKRQELEEKCSKLQKQLNAAYKELDELRNAWRQKKSVTTQTEWESEISEQNIAQSNSHTSGIGTEAPIGEILKEAVEEAIHTSGYVLDEASGMYYDYNSGYYYDANTHLFYDPRTGTYFYFDADVNEYKFHSQVPTTESYTHKPDGGSKRKTHRQKGKRNQKTSAYDLVSSFRHMQISNGQCVETKEKPDAKNAFTNERFVNLQDYPPCIRVIVIESKSLPEGSLHIITYSGGTIGREGNSHVLKLPEVGVSKLHAEISYSSDDKQYFLKDLGSQNGTKINDKLLSVTRTPSGNHEIHHDDVICFGSCKVKVHIHPGSDTCSGCEPGVIQAALAESKAKEASLANTSVDKEQARRKQLKMLKKKYNLAGMDYVQRDPSTLMDEKYKDRAQERRDTKGSDNPYVVINDAPASVYRSIDENNKGHQMLLKMGWKDGESLGKDNTGIKEPITVMMHSAKGGLGSSLPSSIDQPQPSQKVSFAWRKAQERFKQIDIFEVSDEDEDGIETGAKFRSDKSIKALEKYRNSMQWVKGGRVEPEDMSQQDDRNGIT